MAVGEGTKQHAMMAHNEQVAEHGLENGTRCLSQSEPAGFVTTFLG